MKNPRITSLAFLTFTFAATSSLHAQINRWTGATSGNWNTNSNWANGGFPNGTGTDAVFDSAASNFALNLSAPITFRTFFLYGGDYSLAPTTTELLTIAGGGWTQLGSGNFAVSTDINSTSNLNLTGTGAGNLALSGAINTNANSFLKWNTSALSLSSVVTSASTSISGNTPAFSFRAGQSTLSGNGSFVGTGTAGLVTIGFPSTYAAGVFHDNSSAALILDNTGTILPDRLGSRPLAFSQRGLFEYRGNAFAASLETSLGSLSVSGPGTRLRIVPGAGQAARLTFGSLLTPNGLIELPTNGNPTVMQFLVPSGTTLGAPGVAGGRWIFTTPPNTSNNVLRYGIVKDEATGATTFATYDFSDDDGVALGVTAFTNYESTDLNATTATDNVDQSGSVTLLGNSNSNVNALRITPTAAGESIELGANNLRLNNAGGFIFSGGQDYAINGTGSFDTNFVASYFYLNSNTLTVNSTFTRSSEMAKAGDGLLVINGTFNSGSGRQLGVDKGTAGGDDIQVAGPIAGGSTLTKSGQGTLALTGSGNNAAFAPGISVNAGILVLAKTSDTLQNTALGAGTFALQGGTLVARGRAAVLGNTVNLGTVGSAQSGNRILGDQAITFSGLVQGSQSTAQTYPVINDSSALLTLGGNVQAFNANNGSAVVAQMEFSGSGNTQVSGTVRNADPLFANVATMTTGVIKSGSGLLTLSGNNINTGITQINAGYLRLDHANALSSGNLLISETNYSRGMHAVVELGTGNPTFNRATGTAVGQVNLGGTSGNGFNNAGFASVSGISTVNLGGAGATLTWGAGNFFNAGGALILGSPNVAGTIEFQNPINLNANRTINTLNGSAAVDGRLTGIIANGTGSRRLTKIGAGTLELTAENTYTGQTDVLAGTLLVNNVGGFGLASTPVVVSSGATLAGTGSISSVLNSQGTVAPGSNGIGTLTAGSGLIGGTVAIELNGGTSDRLDLTADLNLTGATLAITSLTPAAASSYIIATYTGTFTGNTNPGTADTFAGVTGLPSGYTIVHDTGLKQIRIEGAPVGGNAYDTWAATFPGFTNTAPAVDFESDGIVNLLEFVLGGNPTTNDTPSIRPLVTDSGTNLVVSFSRSDISQTSPLPTTVKVQVSDDLVTWNPANDITIVGDVNGTGPNGATYTVNDSGSIDAIVVTIPKLGAPKKFARVVAVR